MDIKDIKMLIEALDASDINKLHYRKDTEELILEKSPSYQEMSTKIPMTVPTENKIPEFLKKTETSSAAISNTAISSATQVKAPLVGVFYQAPGPETEPFVSVGTQVKTGDTLCIIEAMKVLNEIKAPIDGKIIDIHVKNGEIVSFDQIIMEIDG